jgi:hypothetical protein
MIDTLPLITYIPMAEKLPNKIDLTMCMAFKSKIDKSQCPCRHRPGSRFCGKHAQTKQEILANGTRRSTNRTLLAPSAQIKQHQQTDRNKLLLKTKLITKTQNNISNVSNLTSKINNITQQILTKDPYLSKLTSRQINDNFLFYQLNKYVTSADCLRPSLTLSNNSQRRQTKQILANTTPKQNELTTEYKRKALIRVLTLLARIDNLDPTHRKIIKIQRLVRKYKYRIRQWNRGKGCIYPLIQCTNKDDFCSLDPLDAVPNRLLFTYRDADGFTYGFNLLSLLELLSGCEQPLNPYTRKPIDRAVINRANRYYRILDNWSKVDESDQHTILEQQHNNHIIIPGNIATNNYVPGSGSRLTLKDRIRQRLQTVFQKINYLGYQTNTEWLIDKSVPLLITFIKTLARNWSYQLGFTDATKQALLAHGDLRVFETLVNDAYRNPQLEHSSSLHLMNRILAVLEPLISNPADPNSAALLVLYSLYYIEPRRVIIANPWMG